MKVKREVFVVLVIVNVWKLLYELLDIIFILFLIWNEEFLFLIFMGELGFLKFKGNFINFVLYIVKLLIFFLEVKEFIFVDLFLL